MPTRVALRKLKSGHRHGCTICRLPAESLQVVNTAIWDGGEHKSRGWTARGREMYQLVTGDAISKMSVSRHVEHVEATWRDATPDEPKKHSEVEVFPSDYESLTDAAAELGAKAMTKLAGKIDRDQLPDRELLAAAKLGVQARGEQRKTDIASKQPKIELTAIFGIASGHLAAGALPESEVVDVTPEAQLLEAVHAERQALEENAR